MPLRAPRRSHVCLALLVAAAAPALAERPGSETSEAPSAAPVLPPRLLADSPAPYPEALAGSGLSGVVELELVIDPEGQVDEVSRVSGPHPLLEHAAVHAATGLSFSPALQQGKPIAVRLAFSYRFEVPRAVLTGLVRTKGNRRPVPGATLLVGKPARPVEVDAGGRFRVEAPPGKLQLKVRAPGHEDGAFEEQLVEGQVLEVVYGLAPTTLNPYETIVREGRARTEVSRITLHDQELREVPGTMGDPFRVVMLLPGVGSLLSGIAYPVVRGSQPAATGYFLDGIRVPILFHLFLGPAVIHPDFIDSIDFYPGAPPPEYGRLMGGAINGNLSHPRDDRLHATVYADLINAGLFVEYPIEQTGTNLTVAGRLSYTPWLLAIAANALQPSPPPGQQNPRLVLDFYDYQARLEQRLASGRLRLLAFGSSDVFGTRLAAEGDTALAVEAAQQTILFHRIDLRYQRALGAGEAELGVTYGFDRLELAAQQEQLGVRSDSLFQIDEQRTALRARYQLPLQPGVRLSVGGDVEHREATTRISQELNGRGESAAAPVAVGTFFGGWAEVLFDRGNGWKVVPGLRVDSYHLVPGIDHFAVEPRLAVRRELSEALTLKGGAGFFHQPPITLINLPVIDVAGLSEGLQEGVQLDVGVEWKPFRFLDVTADVYLNPMLRTVEFDLLGGGEAEPRASNPPAAPAPERPRRRAELASHGHAYGFELMLRHPLGDNWFGWISYSLQRSVRFTRFNRYNELGEAVATDSDELPFLFDQTHIVNAVVSYKLATHWTLGAAVHFNTGRPEAGGLTSRTQVEGTQRFTGRAQWVPVDRDRADRLPSFFRVDLRVARAWAFETFVLEAYLDVLNVTMSREVTSFSYLDALPNEPASLEKRSEGLPITLPVLGLKGTY